ncbi:MULTISPECIES: cytochrome c oxidase assembly protein [Nocardiaceae]|uniref:Cytochrome c oxidase assembly protein n=1 Tax=Rhodococcoides corynebacterioides TaxID=53972 RepID=A0ABS2KMT9_9NOCA|nr:MULTISPECIES: cytochrome c oxidase assembly protein [Rhodococcus]MBM7413291.1 hypothetical protein [Rhodococcus corynebacterioides]MBP1115754.1 hypothetical protein [Rhodococcus sp. PvP016]
MSTWALLATACVAGAALWMSRRRLTTRFSQVSVDAALVVAAVSAVVVALLPSVRSAADMSHLAMMTQVMILVMIAPALASGFLRQRIRLSTRVVRVAAVPVALGYVIVMYLWHLPIVTVTGTSAGVLSTAALLVGLCLWCSILSDERPEIEKTRRLTVYVAGIPAGILGLALIIATEPIMAGHVHGTSGLGAIADQRAGGVVMMLVEAVFLIPILLPHNERRGTVSARVA